MAHQAPTRTRTAFLDLPVEVRLNIYGLVFGDSYYIHVERSHDRLKTKQTHFGESSLLRTCRTTYIEARKPYYEAATLVLGCQTYDLFVGDTKNALALSCVRYLEFPYSAEPHKLQIESFPSLVAVNLDSNSTSNRPVELWCSCICDLGGPALYQCMVKDDRGLISLINKVLSYNSGGGIKVFLAVEVACGRDCMQGAIQHGSLPPYIPCYMDLKEKTVVWEWNKQQGTEQEAASYGILSQRLKGRGIGNQVTAVEWLRGMEGDRHRRRLKGTKTRRQ